ncbi:MAG: TIGR00266 family protein [Candidatus Micrarchaeota archaeon]|nr:TIGR00266 family protein [Candidatus Micrarchaeota archaeon]
MNFEINGDNMQSLKIDLGEGESIYADSGKLISKTANVIMTPRLAGGVMSALKREMTGASGFLTEFQPKKGDGFVEIAGVFPGKIFEIDLTPGQEFVAEKYAFLAAEESVKFGLDVVSMGPGFFGGEGWILQKFRGPGKVFIHVVGDKIEYNVDDRTVIEVDPGHVAGFDATVNYKVRFVDNIRTAMLGGVGLFLATFTGNGRIITHSESRTKLALEIRATTPKSGSSAP